jgi:hypothetical protein
VRSFLKSNFFYYPYHVCKEPSWSTNWAVQLTLHHREFCLPGPPSVQEDSFYRDYLSQHSLEATALDETVGVVSRFPGKYHDGEASDISENSSATRDFYMSSCASLLDAMDLPELLDDHPSTPAPNPEPNPSPKVSRHQQDFSFSSAASSSTSPKRTYAQVVAHPNSGKNQIQSSTNKMLILSNLKWKN